MLFDTFEYWIFFTAVFFVVAQLDTLRMKIVLVVASFVFYAFWDVRFVALLLGSTVFNYLTGILIDSRWSAFGRRACLVLAVAINLVVLGFFKYYNFFIDSLARLLSFDPASIALQILLPVGISFFTFEGIAYNVDIYRRTVPARRNLLDFALFISFFPHLIAGPIIRPHEFFPQVGAHLRLTAADFKWGLLQIVKGLIKKLVFSDTVAFYAEAYFSKGAPSATTALVGTVAFGLQIYFDFAGYTDIARGCARLLGFRFPPNFERPYLATNISDFWRRWHISLSTWLRDYLYIPLGGNRGGTLARYRNYIIVMGLGGLWHGASWNFLVWGLYHGALLAWHRLYLDFAPAWVQTITQTRGGASVAWLVTVVAVFIGWIPFRARNWDATLGTLRELFSVSSLDVTAWPTSVLLLAAIAALYCGLDRGRWIERCVEERMALVPFLLGIGVVLWLMSIFAVRNVSVPFIYFQF